MFGRIGAKGVASAFLLASAWCPGLQAMDRWAALSQLESGDNDQAVGAAGEVSRYQMKPELWRRYAFRNADWHSAADALRVAQEVMKNRCAEFEVRYHRSPNDFEFYILWNAPARVRNPGKTIRERAERFCNLVESN